MVVFDLWSMRYVPWMVFSYTVNEIVLILALWYFSVFSTTGEEMRLASVGWFLTM